MQKSQDSIYWDELSWPDPTGLPYPHERDWLGSPPLMLLSDEDRARQLFKMVQVMEYRRQLDGIH